MSEKEGGYTKVLANFNRAVDHTDESAVKDMVFKKLVMAMESAETPREIVSLGRELLDRLEGTPVQSVRVAAIVKHVGIAQILEEIDGESKDL